MSDTASPHDDDPDAQAPSPSAPFVRQFSTLAAAPWDQARAARLEATHGAPLPAHQLRIVLRRLGRWRPGAPASFAAAYFRRDAVGEEQRHVEMLEGQPVEFVARGDNAQRRTERLRRLDIGLALGAILALLLASGLSLGRRAELDSQLREADVTTQRALQAGREARRRVADARALDRAGARGALLANALGDLDWLARAHRPDAVVEDVEWTPAEMRVAAHGAQSPIATADRPVMPGDEARTSGVRVWRISPAPVNGATQ